MYQGAAQDPSPRKILVLHGSPNSETRATLRRLGIEVLEYVWENGEPAFPGLSQLDLIE